MFEWSDLRHFLEVYRTGTLTLAGRRLGVDQTTVARRPQVLEQAVGTQLFDHTTAGHKLTVAGLKLLPRAEAMETMGIAIEAEIAGRDHALSGLVRIGATEGFGNFFLAQRLPVLNDRQPNLDIELISIPRFVNLSNREADIAIGQERPAAGRIVASKLTDYVLHLYAAPEYLAGTPKIQSRKDLDSHAFIGYVDDLLYTKELRYLESMRRTPRLTFSSTSIIAQYNAAIAGAGIAILPAYMISPSSGLQIVLPNDVKLIRSYWITTRSEQLKLARVRTAWDFIKEVTKHQQDAMLGCH